MKLRKIFYALCGMLVLGTTACCGSDKTVDINALPAPVKTFVDTHFAGEKIQSATVDTDDAVAEYDVILANGTKVEIDRNGAWESVCNCKSQAVPVTMLPDTTQTYIATNFPGCKVVKVEKDRKGYEVKFENGTELEFDTQGVFVKIDR